MTFAMCCCSGATGERPKMPAMNDWAMVVGCLASVGSAQPAQGLRREVGEDHVGAGALEREQGLERAGALVEPTVRRRGLEHRVLAAHLVGGGRRTEAVLHAPQHVEVRQ